MDRPTDTRQRILDAARELFHARSYADVGVKEICDVAQVQKGSFYHFFASKRDLAVAVIEDTAAQWASGLLANAFATDLPPLERFDRLIDAAYRLQRDHKAADGHMPGCPFGNLAVEISTQDEILRAKLDGVFGLARDRFRQALQDAQAVGEAPPMDVNATADAMFAYLEGILLLAKTRNDPDLLLALGPAIKQLRVGME